MGLVGTRNQWDKIGVWMQVFLYFVQFLMIFQCYHKVLDQNLQLLNKYSVDIWVCAKFSAPPLPLLLTRHIFFPGDGCVDKPLATLWKNHMSTDKPNIMMKVTVCASGLKAVTKEHGLTEYWAHRITFCQAEPSYPKVFCWIYR